MRVSLKILNTVLRKYGNFKNFSECNGGPLLAPAECRQMVALYLQKENIDIPVNYQSDAVAAASISKRNGLLTLNIKPTAHRQKWFPGTLDHEIGTHYFRSHNNQQQPWKRKAGRKKYSLSERLQWQVTEEGFAALHTVRTRDGQHLWRAAILYYTTYLACNLSFRKLFNQLAQFVKDPQKRWEYCVRAKRGLLDTSRPGCFTKDQIYLQGALEILEKRDRLDFIALYAGKLTLDDANRMSSCQVTNRSKIRLPSFMKNLEAYRESLDAILANNGLSDKDLRLKSRPNSSAKMRRQSK